VPGGALAWDGLSPQRQGCRGGTPTVLGGVVPEVLGDRARDLLGGRVKEVEVHEPTEPAAQIAIQSGFDHRPELARSNDHQLIEGSTSVRAQKQLSKASCMLVEVLFDQAGQAKLRAVTRHVPAVESIVQRGELNERSRPTSE
jgi:hypothetical protein